MIDSFPPFAVSLVLAGLVGFGAWLAASAISSKIEHHRLESRINERLQDYVRKDAFDEFRKEFIKEFKDMRILMHEIAGKLGIPIRRE